MMQKTSGVFVGNFFTQEYVDKLNTDHIAEIERLQEEIAALQKLIADMKVEWEASICIPCEVSVCDVKNENYRYQKDITALKARIEELETSMLVEVFGQNTARIKELEGALEKTRFWDNANR